MKQIPLIIVLIVLLLSGCGGGGGGGGKKAPQNNGDTSVKPAVEDAAKTAPWKDQTAVTPDGSQLGNAKSNLDSVTSLLLVGIVSSGKKNRTDVIEESYPGPIRGSMDYKNTYTFDDVVVGDAYSYSDVTEIKFNGYEDVDFGINGTATFSVTFNQTSEGNSTYTMTGNCSVSYKDATGVFAFYMAYEDVSTMVNGVETIESSYEIDGETYTSTTVIQVNGDSVYTTTYVEDGITYTSVSTYIGGTTTYEVSHIENGVKVIDEESSSDYSTSTDSNGVTTEVYSYTYEEDGVVYTSTSTTVNGITTTELSHLENGVKVVDSTDSSSYEIVTIDGVESEVYTYVYTEDGIVYTSTTITSGDTTSYTTSHEENGETIIDSSSTSTTSIVNGVTIETYTETYIENGITYTYTSTTSDESSSYLTTHLENGQVVIDNQSTYTQTVENGKIVETYIDIYTVDGIQYTSTSKTVDGITTVEIHWIENGVEYTDTYTY